MTPEVYLGKLAESIDTLSAILDTENYGMCVVDRNGFIVKWNYEKFLHIKADAAVGLHVTQVLENTRLHIVAQTGEPELMQLQEIGGKSVITNRIPLRLDGRLIGAAGTILFRDIRELDDLNRRMVRLEDSFEEYQSEIAKMYASHYHFSDIITQSSEILRLKTLAETVAPSDAPVLLQGESGTGKELFAQAIHNASLVSRHPFISINCASIPKDLMEAELFGYESGAFTGARKEGHIGKLELAGEGTLFLDELGNMSYDMQIKLLRVLETKEFERLGGTRRIPFRARVIAATNENLADAVSEHRFRSDLYYRLNVISLTIPPLRSRPEDIRILSVHLLEQVSGQHANTAPQISEDAMVLLLAHNWPGNIRELRNVMQRAAIICEGQTIYPQHLPDYIQAYAPDPVPDDSGHGSYYHLEIARLEKQMILQALEANHGSRAAAARALGIHRSLLYKKMQEYRLS